MQNHNRARFTTARKVEVDIHNMTCEQARRYLEQFLGRLDGSVREVTVIHGYSGGTVLRDMVRNSLRHPRIQAKYRSMNPGVTILILH